MANCKCTFAQRMIGDGCDVYNPTLALEYAYDTIKDLHAKRDVLQNRLVTLQRILSGVKKQRDALRAFAQDVMAAWPEGAVDGGDLQDAAERHKSRFDCPDD